MNAKDKREALEAAFDARDRVAIQLRLPRDLHERLRFMAEANQRSLNGELVHALALHARPMSARPSDALAAYLHGELDRMGDQVPASTRTGFDTD